MFHHHQHCARAVCYGSVLYGRMSVTRVVGVETECGLQRLL
jgi:hypothetical protein